MMQNNSIQHFPAVVHAFKKTDAGEVFVKQQVIFSEKEMDDFREKFPGHSFRVLSHAGSNPLKNHWWKKLFNK